MVLKAINKDKYFLSTVIISLMVAVLIHFPESVSLFDRFESHSLFPGMKFMDVANEILFTFVSLLILFAINTRLFHFNQASIKITAAKILLSFILTWILSNLLGQVFVFLHRTFDIPAIDAMVHHYLHPLRDFIMACLVTSSCCIIYLVRRQQLVLIENEQLQAENIRNQYEVLKNQSAHVVQLTEYAAFTGARKSGQGTGLYSGTLTGTEVYATKQRIAKRQPAGRDGIRFCLHLPAENAL